MKAVSIETDMTCQQLGLCLLYFQLSVQDQVDGRQIRHDVSNRGIGTVAQN